MENMREYWAREAEMMRDKSAILGTKDNSSSSNTLSFSQNIRKSVELLDDNKVSFGLNRIRNVAKSGLFDERMWSIVNDSTLRLNQGRTPAQGIQSILNNSCSKWTLDCAQYVQVVYLGACLLTDGPTQFNKYINDLLIGKGQSNFELHSHGTVGVENKDFYTRGVFNDAFRLDTDFDSKSVGKTEADLLRLAPIGSRITVANFQAYALVGSKNTEYKKYGEGVFLSG